MGLIYIYTEINFIIHLISISLTCASFVSMGVDTISDVPTNDLVDSPTLPLPYIKQLSFFYIFEAIYLFATY